MESGGRLYAGCGEVVCMVWVYCLMGVGRLSGGCVEAV